MTTVAGPSMIGPMLQPDISGLKKAKKQRKSEERAIANEEMAEDSDASSSSTLSRQERKERKRREKEQRRQERQRSSSADVSMTSASETEGEGIGSNNGQVEKSRSEKPLSKMKGRGPPESAFETLYPEIDLCIPPILLHDPNRAASEQLDSLTMRYIPQFGGVLMSHTDTKLLEKYGKIDGDGAFANVRVRSSCTVWAPKIGMRLEGKIKLSTPSHVSLIVNGTFNASITSSHLPAIQEMAHMPKETGFEWQEFSEEEYGEDVDMSQGVIIEPSAQMGEEEEKITDETAESNEINENGEEEIGEKSTGCWIDKKTGSRLGGESGTVVFTVVGITIANHMISIHGSLLRKPFSIPAPTYNPITSSLSNSSSTIRNANSSDSRRVRFGANETSEFAPYEEDDDGDSDDSDQGEDDPSYSSANVQQSIEVQSTDEKSGKGKKKRSKVGPHREGETSGSESEGESSREKKKRRKSSN